MMAIWNLQTCHFVQYVPETEILKEVFIITEIKKDPEWFGKHRDTLKEWWDNVNRAKMYLEKQGKLPPDLEVTPIK